MTDKELIKRLVIVNEGCCAFCKKAYYARYVGMTCDYDDVCSIQSDYHLFELNRELIEREYNTY